MLPGRSIRPYESQKIMKEINYPQHHRLFNWVVVVVFHFRLAIDMFFPAENWTGWRVKRVCIYIYPTLIFQFPIYLEAEVESSYLIYWQLGATGSVQSSGQISSRPHTTDFPQMVVNSKGNPLFSLPRWFCIGIITLLFTFHTKQDRYSLSGRAGGVPARIKLSAPYFREI